jgi:O-antigen ligase
MFYAVAAYFLIAKIFAAPPGARRWLCGLGLLLFTGAIFIGRARGSVIGFLIGLIPLFLVLRPREQFQVTLGVVMPGIALMALLFLLPTQQRVEGNRQWDLGNRGLESFTRMGNKDYDPTGSYRLDMWRRAFMGFLEAPVFGKGYGWRIYVKRDYNEEAPAAVIHNSYLHTLVCGGVVGAIPLAWLVGGCLLELWRRWRHAEPGLPRLLAAACFSAALNFFLMAVTNVGFEIVVPAAVGWVLVAMAIQVSRLGNAELAALVPYRRRADLSSSSRAGLRRQGVA